MNASIRTKAAPAPEVAGHYIYLIHANAYPIYVGHGHKGRFSDRARFIDSLVRLHPDLSYKKWARHGLVVADLWAQGVDVIFDQLTAGQTRAQAKRQENEMIISLAARGFLLANVQKNSNRCPPADTVTAVLVRTKIWPALRKLKPIERRRRAR